jgi:chromate transporter
MGIMQMEVQERRAWIPKEQFIEGLALVNTLPGPSGIQLGVFLGYTRAVWWGGVLAGLCFILVRGLCRRLHLGAVGAVVAVYLPSFILMLSALPMLERVKRLAWMKAALQGISPAVIGMTAVAVLRMQPYAVSDSLTRALATEAVVAMLLWRLNPLVAHDRRRCH